MHSTDYYSHLEKTILVSCVVIELQSVLSIGSPHSNFSQPSKSISGILKWMLVSAHSLQVAEWASEGLVWLEAHAPAVSCGVFCAPICSSACQALAGSQSRRARARRVEKLALSSTLITQIYSWNHRKGRQRQEDFSSVFQGLPFFYLS